MLAYLFWHRPRPGVEREEYEQAQRQFHASLEIQSACFRLERLPFEEEPGYEDWYLVDDWAALGELNRAAVDATHRPSHDGAAALVGDGWGGVYACVRGEPTIPAAAEWRHKPRGEPSSEFLARFEEGLTVWQRQMVLGPAPELCVATETEGEPPAGRRALLGTEPPRP